MGQFYLNQVCIPVVGCVDAYRCFRLLTYSRGGGGGSASRGGKNILEEPPQKKTPQNLGQEIIITLAKTSFRPVIKLTKWN